MSATARYPLEDLLVGLLNTADTTAAPALGFPEGLRLGVSIVAGRTKKQYPVEYIAINGDREEERGDGAWLVTASIWFVTDVENSGAVAASQQRLGKVAQWLRHRLCPARRHSNDVICLSGYNVQQSEPVSSGQSFADVLLLRCGVQVY